MNRAMRHPQVSMTRAFSRSTWSTCKRQSHVVNVIQPDRAGEKSAPILPPRTPSPDSSHQDASSPQTLSSRLVLEEVSHESKVTVTLELDKDGGLRQVSSPLGLGSPSPGNPRAASHWAAGLGPLSEAMEGVANMTKGMLLPSGFPRSVTSDYLEYQLYALPCHVSGYVSMSITTSTMLKAVGISAGPVGAVAAGAAVKWIIKDGIGALGRFVVGSRLSRSFDEDPKHWRMIAELISTGGICLEIATLLRPDLFLLLAGSGTLARAVSKSISRPAFRVLQAHFSSVPGYNNVGDVAAKEEVWEVIGQLLGLAIGVLVLQKFETGGDPYTLLETWAAVQVVHVALRYRALSAVRPRTINRKRANRMVGDFLAGLGVPTPDKASAGENLFLPPWGVGPQLDWGSIRDIAARCDGERKHVLKAVRSPSPALAGPAMPPNGNGNGNGVTAGYYGVDPGTMAPEMARVLTVFSAERFVLVRSGGRALAALRDDACGSDLLRAVWLTCALRDRGWGSLGMATPEELSQALGEVEARWGDFVDLAERSGWDLSDRSFVVRLPDQRYRIVEAAWGVPVSLSAGMGLMGAQGRTAGAGTPEGDDANQGGGSQGSVAGLGAGQVIRTAGVPAGGGKNSPASPRPDRGSDSDWTF